MKDSLFTRDYEHCAWCGKENPQRHHVFGGKNRKNSDADGLWIPLCMEHHTGQNGVHHNIKMNLAIKRTAQVLYERDHTREAFIQRYGRNYL